MPRGKRRPQVLGLVDVALALVVRNSSAREVMVVKRE